MINKIDYLKEQICKKELLSYQEGDYFYIMNQNNTDTFILIQATDDNIIVWSYDTLIVSFDILISKIEQIFGGEILFPHVENDNDKMTLLDNGYQYIDFVDDTEEERNIYPSLVKRIIEKE